MLRHTRGHRSKVALAPTASCATPSMPAGASLDEASRTPHPRRSGRSDSAEDRSRSPEAPGPRVFGSRIRNAPFPQRYRPPTNITRYAREMNPSL